MINNRITARALQLIRHETFGQIAKYFVVGGLCTVMDFCLLYCLTQYLHIHYVLSSAISFMSGTFLNYLLCTIWIFKVRVVENRSLELLYYSIITAVGLGINTLIIWYLTDFLNLYYMGSKLFATFATFWWNFAARKYFLHTIK